MILTAHQPVYLPWLGLFHKIALSDVFVSFNQVQYQMKDWNNRNRIKTANGAQWLSVPVQKKGRFDRIYTDIEIDDTQNWQKKHWMSIVQAYSKAPFFKKYADELEFFYKTEFLTLAELNEKMLLMFLKILNITVLFKNMADYSFGGQKSGLVLDMCKQLGAKLFIFGAQGKDYAEQNAFASEGIETTFQDYKHPHYAQLHGDFIPNLSIIDLLFNCGDDSLAILMSGNIDRTGLKNLCQN